ncbi:retrovirus-related pol polyprotein from transposon TNT 1-94 [Tanacetum coccineum]
MYRIDNRTTKTRAPQLSQTSRNIDPRVFTSIGVIHRTNVSRPQLRGTQIRDKVMSNNSQVKFKKTEVEDHHRISSISNKTKFVTACNDSLKSRTLKLMISKDETPEVLKDFLKMIQRNLQAQVIYVRIDRGTKFLNKTLHAYFKEEGIKHQTSTPRTPE